MDLTVQNIQRRLRVSQLPQAGRLRELLEFPSLIMAVKDHVEDLREFADEPATLTSLAGAALNLTSFEDTLMRLRRGVAWSEHHLGFNWWLRHRLEELGLSDYVVIPLSGSSREFRIESTPTLLKRLQESSAVHQYYPNDSQENGLRRVRLLTVPHFDGASPRWHPISLGHELAHLKYTKDWVHEWLASHQTRRTSGHEAVAVAKREPKAMATYADNSLRWFGDLKSWLSETACDAVMNYFYGDEGASALSYYLSVHSDVGDTVTHPSPSLRLAALRVEGPDDLKKFKIKEAVDPHQKLLRNGYCDLAVSLRESVYQSLERAASTVFVENRQVRSQILKHATDSLEAGLPPRSEHWEEEVVRLTPSVVETALVGAEWCAILAGGSVLYQDEGLELARLENRVDQAVNFLQFQHRFATVKDHLEKVLGQSSRGPTLCNVVHVGINGVGPYGDDGGRGSAFDVRLGRHFIVFRRNRVATLHSLRGGEDARQMQELVEVGWGDDFVLHPGEMVLGVTLESVAIDRDCIAQVLSRSSLGRMGLLSATAVHVQPGFKGCLTLELVNLASVPLSLAPGQRIAQIVALKARGESNTYSGKYQDQNWRPRFSAVQEDAEVHVLEGLKHDAVQSS